MPLVKNGVWVLAAVFAAGAGVMDWRWRRIPNWWTIPGLLVGVMANAAAGGWPGAKSAFAGAALGLLLLLPLVVIRSLGAGDWKLVGALGAFLGPEPLLRVLAVAIVVAGVMGIALAIYKGRLRETLVNMGHMLAAFFTLRLPGPALTLENPQALKVPFGVAAAVAAIAYVGARFVFGVV